VEIILERVTNIAMGTELDGIVEFEALADADITTTPTTETPH
jgi:tartronate-semialdehyde synthase